MSNTMNMKSLPSLLLRLLVLVSPVVVAGCSAPVDLTKAMAVTAVTTGWYDAGIVPSSEGEKNKLVPSISFALKNQSQAPVASVQINAVFKRVGEAEEWGSAWVKGIGPEGLAPGASTASMVLRCPLGYTGLQPRAQMLVNPDFIDARVSVFGKHGAANWVKLGEYQIQRQLLTR
jgi:hypothetical protein